MANLRKNSQVSKREGAWFAAIYGAVFLISLVLNFTGTITEPSLQLSALTMTGLIQAVVGNLGIVLLFLLLSVLPIKWLGQVVLCVIILGTSEGGVRLILQVSLGAFAGAALFLVKMVSNVALAYALTLLDLEIIDLNKFQSSDHYLVNWWRSVFAVNKRIYWLLVVAFVINSGVSPWLQR